VKSRVALALFVCLGLLAAGCGLPAAGVPVHSEANRPQGEAAPLALGTGTAPSPVYLPFAAAGWTPPEARAYRYLCSVMDRYGSGRSLRLLESYDDSAGFADGDVAWVYDNAVAIVALLASGSAEGISRALLLGDALLYAQAHDPEFADGRLRDAYRASAFVGRDGKVTVAEGGSATGNMAWAILALLGCYEASGDQRYLAGAERLADWLCAHTKDDTGLGGYVGGYSSAQARLTWKATEHNLDVYAALYRLYLATGKERWLTAATRARSFVESMWHEEGGHFWTGTLEDGRTLNPSPIPEDAQSWGVLVLGPRAGYSAALDWALANLLEPRCSGCPEHTGMRFSDRGAGCWWEGLAHMALALDSVGRASEAEGFREALKALQSQGATGALPAACPGGADTGFGWSYPSAPHVGATAWFLLALQRHNPFWNQNVASPLPVARER